MTKKKRARAISSSRFKRLMQANGFDELRFHSLRHTFAVSSLRAGDDI